MYMTQSLILSHSMWLSIEFWGTRPKKKLIFLRYDLHLHNHTFTAHSSIIARTWITFFIQNGFSRHSDGRVDSWLNLSCGKVAKVCAAELFRLGMNKQTNRWMRWAQWCLSWRQNVWVSAWNINLSLSHEATEGWVRPGHNMGVPWHTALVSPN